MGKEKENSELNALISLLDEPDNAVFSKIRERFFVYGAEAIPALESAWEDSFDAVIQKRIEDLIHEIQLKNLYAELTIWRLHHDDDLLKGFLLISKYPYPLLDEKKLMDQMGQIIQDVWLELNANLTPLEKIKVINHILFDVHKFTGNKADLHTPQNNFLKDILETKKANPVSLSIIYMIVAQSLRIPVYGVNLPQNFIMAYMDRSDHKLIKFTHDDVQFYINAFNRGAVFTRREVEMFVKQLNLGNKDIYYLPCDNVTILERVFNNLIFAFENSGQKTKAEEIRYLQQALTAKA